MRIQEFENCVSVTMPKFCVGFLLHHAFHAVASAPQAAVAKSPTTVADNQLSCVEHLRQAFQRLVIAARVAAV